ncbi:hypothetical protein [Bowmanella dokdonensis]|uniref:Phage protein n=1 Tax=Bowmanella dokdonensis TaxID=751969 RepID=A0A939DLI9_9ALTE|nr:hypothetical protein [Bowmanella dokdonensis]MBN7824780.1 hypothetical protein [Bowmanella dokdonensis]
MAFKLSDLKGWTVKRTVEVRPGSSFELEIKVLSEEEGQAITDQGSDLKTCEGFLAAVKGFQDEKGKEQPLEAFLAFLGKWPSLYHKVAIECVNAQHDAAIKNS